MWSAISAWRSLSLHFCAIISSTQERYAHASVFSDTGNSTSFAFCAINGEFQSDAKCVVETTGKSISEFCREAPYTDNALVKK